MQKLFIENNLTGSEHNCMWVVIYYYFEIKLKPHVTYSWNIEIQFLFKLTNQCQTELHS